MGGTGTTGTAAQNNASNSSAASAAAYVLERRVADLADHVQLAAVLASQQGALASLQEAKEQLTRFNAYSAALHASLTKDFAAHLRTLAHMRRQLEEIYRRVRAVKAALGELEQ